MDATAIFDNPMFCSIAFVPRKASRQRFASATVVDGDIPGATDGATLGYRLYKAPSAACLFLFFHGNAEVTSDYDSSAPEFAAIGASLMVVDFAGYGWSTGSPKITTLAADAEAVALRLPALLSEVGYPADFPVVLFGRSIGSVCAIHLAARFPTQFHGLIIESGIASLLELPMVAMLAAGMPMIAVLVSRLPDPWANKAKMASVSIRTLIIHGERDEISPVAQGSALFAACATPEAEKEFLRLRAGHNDLLSYHKREYFAAVKRVVDAVAPAAAAAVRVPASTDEKTSTCNCL